MFFLFDFLSNDFIVCRQRSARSLPLGYDGLEYVGLNLYLEIFTEECYNVDKGLHDMVFYFYKA